MDHHKGREAMNSSLPQASASEDKAPDETRTIQLKMTITRDDFLRLGQAMLPSIGAVIHNHFDLTREEPATLDYNFARADVRSWDVPEKLRRARLVRVPTIRIRIPGDYGGVNAAKPPETWIAGEVDFISPQEREWLRLRREVQRTCRAAVKELVGLPCRQWWLWRCSQFVISIGDPAASCPGNEAALGCYSYPGGIIHDDELHLIPDVWGGE
jgi:hypothetical protein